MAREASRPSIMSSVMATEGELKDLGDQIADVAEGVAKNGDAIEGLAGRIDGLDSRVQRLTTEVNDLRTEQSRAFADVLVVLQDVRDHTQGIPSLSERLQKTRDAIDFLGRKALKPEDYEQLKAIAGL
jgi:chromosome segregation ATPase